MAQASRQKLKSSKPKYTSGVLELSTLLAPRPALLCSSQLAGYLRLLYSLPPGEKESYETPPIRTLRCVGSRGDFPGRRDLSLGSGSWGEPL